MADKLRIKVEPREMPAEVSIKFGSSSIRVTGSLIQIHAALGQVVKVIGPYIKDVASPT